MSKQKLESTVSIELVGLLSDVETVTAILTKQLRVIDQSIDVEQGRGFIRRYIVLGGDGEETDADFS